MREHKHKGFRRIGPRNGPIGFSFFSDCIFTRRMDLGLTRKSLAAAVGVHPSTIYYWERWGLGRTPRPRDFNGLCQALDLSPLQVLEEMGYEAGTYGQAVGRGKKSQRPHIIKAA